MKVLFTIYSELMTSHKLDRMLDSWQMQQAAVLRKI